LRKIIIRDHSNIFTLKRIVIVNIPVINTYVTSQHIGKYTRSNIGASIEICTSRSNVLSMYMRSTSTAKRSFSAFWFALYDYSLEKNVQTKTMSSKLHINRDDVLPIL
jgi:hypothetical protein